ncbi:MAG: peptidoglycan-associated lipoprotein Pal [Deltaproteobacteria bacterium]|nr:peptidoglycan-associated lipoprotein Pal [Deltaproteobacteria bacterium]
MRNRNLILFSLLVLAVAFATGCAKRGLTKSDMDRGDAIEAKIARAEKMGIKNCNPKELAAAKATLAHARHEAAEKNYDKAEVDAYFAAADKAADDLIAMIGPCMEKMTPKPIAMAAAPTVTLTAEPETIMKGECATLTWSSTDATGAEIDQGIGDVGTSGSRKVCPPESIRYTITGAGAGGTATSSATVNVTQVVAAPMMENIHFDFDQSFIRGDAKPILGNVAAYMKKNPGANLQIEGHCDERGTSEYNIALGQRRADSTRKYLSNLGIDGKRISTISYGEEKPADPGHNEAAWAKNRRAVFVIR